MGPLICWAVMAGVFLAVSPAALAETFPLRLKRLEPVGQAGQAAAADQLYRMAQPQHFFLGFQGQDSPSDQDFGRLIRKEPARYRSKVPFRGVVTLGSWRYGFVLDTAAADSDEYSRLYFDQNHNGDLTDDPVIEGKSGTAGSSASYFPPGYGACQFPRVDLTVDVDGVRTEYSFFFQVYSAVASVGVDLEGGREEPAEGSQQKELRYLSAMLYPACYREGEIRVAGKTRRVVLLDFNSNGRFGDRVEPARGGRGLGGLRFGDALFLDPDPEASPSWGLYDWVENQVAKVLSLDGRLYDLAISPGGDRLTIAPSSVPSGQVMVPTDGFQAIVQSDLGVMKIAGDKSQAAAVPAGTWRLISYTIDRTHSWNPAQAQGKGQAGASLLQALAGAVAAAAGPRPTRLSAYGDEDTKPLVVEGGRAVSLPFGPPLRPTVSASTPLRPGGTVRLGLELVGSGGESITSLTVAGTRPEKPQFTITDPDGKEVATGAFEYG